MFPNEVINKRKLQDLMYLTFHKNKNKAICHHCSSEKKLYNKSTFLIIIIYKTNSNHST